MTSAAKLAVVASFTSAPAASCCLASFAASPVPCPLPWPRQRPNIPAMFQLPLGALARANRRHCRNTPAPKCVFSGEIATVHCRPGIALAFPAVFPYIILAELRGACWISIPGALSISKGAVPGLARGLGHTAPTYIVGSRDRYPTAIAAPRLPSSRRLRHVPHQAGPARAGFGAAGRDEHRGRRLRRASRGRRPRPRPAPAPRDRRGLFSASGRILDLASP